MSFRKITRSCLLGLTILTVNCLTAKSQAIWYNREELNDNSLTNTLTVSYDHNSFLYGRNGSYSQSRSLVVAFDSSPFSDGGFGSLLSGYGRVGVIDPNNFSEDIKASSVVSGVVFSNGSMMAFEGGLQLGTQIGNRARTFFILPHFNLGLNYNTKNSISPMVDDKLALKTGAGANLMITGRYLSSNVLKNCFLLMRNDFFTDTRGTLTKSNRIATDPTKRWQYNNSIAIGFNF